MDQDCIYLVRTNKNKHIFNFKYVQQLPGKKRNIPAYFYPEENAHKALKMDVEKNFKLVRHLVLCRGAKVMINQNINVGLGVANGSLGTI